MQPITLKDIPPDEPETSRSADTIRQLPLHVAGMSFIAASSRPDSPRISPPPSPHSSYPSPSSPSGESVSSLPSVSSSFMFSMPGTPPHIGLGLHHDPHGQELGDNSLIIPSLTLPSAVRRPTPYGQTLGDVRILVLGHVGSDAEGVAQVFADEECEDIVEVEPWEEFEVEADGTVHAKLLRLSTDWIEHRDAHGLETHEPSRNVEVVLFQDYGPKDDTDGLLRVLLQVVHAPFRTLASVLNPEQSPNGLLASLLASPASPLYLAMVLIPSHQLSLHEQRLIAELSTHVPLIVLPNPRTTSARSAPLHDQSPYSRRPSLQGLHHSSTSDLLRSAKLASVRPHSAHAFRSALFRSPEALASLRLDAAERFMRWREVERAVGHVLGGTSPPPETERTPVVSRTDPLQRQPPSAHTAQRWDKARWEVEWEGALATDVAKTLRARRGAGAGRRQTITAARVPRPQVAPVCADVGVGTSGTHDEAASAPAYFDPLHLPSLLAFSLSLLGPLKARLARMFTSPRASPASEKAAEAGLPEGDRWQPSSGGVTWALVGAFCAGVGVGIMLSRSL
ncbi:hypothetical protein PHLGIDRAFT_125265 [Phlebiopsis gigantea 11061_1 CR5-6]|uniref:Uncharacterized protein n=1 Tax=Phlebiopsis gigantea (strain 11061_1 CR5-6) TaxID=745531 RepID=A0A0C3SCA6_PHLG1|nr:hypothetical protein PHLGIDRAFT_125265 [Phlebiopsis gigantea 11061_1 CR5-6]